MKSKSIEKCIIQTSLNESCPKNCKNTIRHLQFQNSEEEKCIAKEKMNAFLEGKTSFSVGISAFYQASSYILEIFREPRKTLLRASIYPMLKSLQMFN